MNVTKRHRNISQEDESGKHSFLWAGLNVAMFAGLRMLDVASGGASIFVETIMVGVIGFFAHNFSEGVVGLFSHKPSGANHHRKSIHRPTPNRTAHMGRGLLAMGH